MIMTQSDRSEPTERRSTREVRLAAVCSNSVRQSLEELPFVSLELVDPGMGRLLTGFPDATFQDGAVQFHQPDVLYGKLRPYLQKVLHLGESGHCSSELLVLSPDEERLLPRYLYYIVLSPRFAAFAESHSYGTKMPRTSWAEIRRYRFRLPPIGQQIDIAEKLDLSIFGIDEVLDRLGGGGPYPAGTLGSLLIEKRIALISSQIDGPV